jgi:hypothetical protein
MTGLYLAAAILALLPGLRAALRLRRERSPVVVAPALCMLAGGAALVLEAVTPALSAAGPFGPVAGWAAAVLGMVAAWAFLGMLVVVAGEAASLVPFLAVPAGAVVLAGLVPAVLAGASRAVPGAALPSGFPAAAVGLVVMACYCAALGKTTALAWRCSARIPVRHVAMGMRAVGAGAAAGIVLLLARSAEVVMAAYRVSACGPRPAAAGMAQGIVVILVIAGVTVPAWFPAAASAVRQCGMWVAWVRLRPLWASLVEAAPHVRLPAQPGTRFSARYRLHRRVVEIRDAELALRPFRDGRAARAAADAARRAGLPPHEHDAAVEAVLIVTALGAHRRGDQARECAHGEHIVSEPRNGLESETARLLLVGRAVRRSPVVRQAAAAAGRPPVRMSAPSALARDAGG